MGHLRIGALPRSKNWRSVVSAIGGMAGGQIATGSYVDLADKTLVASQRELRKLPDDIAFQRCFQFLVVLSVAGKSENVQQVAKSFGLNIDGIPTKLELSKSLRTWLSGLDPYGFNPEYASLARQATADTIATWINQHATTPQLSLFSQSEDPYKPWRIASTGAGFCELSRSFFSNFTDRYLKYFLSRTASSQFSTVEDRNQFSNSIRSNVDLVTTHAFETSKIVQSFSAGWFNKNASELNLPAIESVRGFLGFSIEKIREEFRREMGGI